MKNYKRQIWMCVAVWGGILVLLSLTLRAQEAPKPVVLPEDSKNHLLAAYEKFLLAQQSVNFAANEYREAAAEEIKKNHLPEGTTFNNDVNSNSVTVILPPAKESPKLDKPAEKK